MLKRIQKSLLNELNKTVLFISITIMILMCLVFTFIVKNYSYQIYQNLNSIPNINFAIKSDLTSTNRFNTAQFTTNIKQNKYVWNEYLNNAYNDFYTLVNKDYINYGNISYETSQIFFLESYSENDGILYQTDFANASPINDNALEICESDIYMIEQLKQNNVLAKSHEIIAIDKEDFLDKHYAYLNDLIDGRYLNEKEIENGEQKIVLGGRSFLYKNGEFKELHVGDYLTMSLFVKDGNTRYVSKEYEFEIVGIYDGYNSKSNYSNASIYNYISLNCLNNIINENKDFIENDTCTIYACYLGPVYLTQGMLTINSLNDISKFIEDFKQINNEDKNYTYETNADSYIDLAGRIDGVYESFNYLFIFSLIACTLVLLFMIELDVSNRKQEIGILLTLGTSKKEICIQFIIEYLIKIIFPLLITIVFAHSFSNVFLNKILNINDIDFNVANTMIQSISVNTTYSLTYANILTILLLTILVTIPSVLVTLIIILKTNVKEILLGQ